MRENTEQDKEEFCKVTVCHLCKFWKNRMHRLHKQRSIITKALVPVCGWYGNCYIIRTDNQPLGDMFLKWPRWVHLIIRVNKCYTFGIKENIIRKWLQILFSGNISHQRYQRYNNKTAEEIHAQCKLSIRTILKTSRNAETRKPIWTCEEQNC